MMTPVARAGKATESRGLIEKPAPNDAPSRLGVVRRYILQPEIMANLEHGECGAGNEIQLTDAMAGLIGRQRSHALSVNALRYDCGDKARFVLANLAIALYRPNLAQCIKDLALVFLKNEHGSTPERSEARA